MARAQRRSLDAADTLAERWESEWLASAHREAASWGAVRFAAEFRRRDMEERRLRDSEARALGRGGDIGPDGVPSAEPLMWGPVASEVAEHVVGLDRGGLELHRPIRHPFVPRPPDPEPERRRGRRRKGDRGTREPASTITAQEAARMSPAGRRLYGLEERPNRRGR